MNENIRILNVLCTVCNFFFFRWSSVSLSTPLFNNDSQTNNGKEKPVRSCQRALKFFNTSESIIQKNLFDTKPSQKELSKLHKQVIILYALISH